MDVGCTMIMKMKLPILPCVEKLELVLSTAPKHDRDRPNTDKDSKNRQEALLLQRNRATRYVS